MRPAGYAISLVDGLKAIQALCVAVTPTTFSNLTPRGDVALGNCKISAEDFDEADEIFILDFDEGMLLLFVFIMLAALATTSSCADGGLNMADGPVEGGGGGGGEFGRSILCIYLAVERICDNLTNDDLVLLPFLWIRD